MLYRGTNIDGKVRKGKCVNGSFLKLVMTASTRTRTLKLADSDANRQDFVTLDETIINDIELLLASSRTQTRKLANCFTKRVVFFTLI